LLLIHGEILIKKKYKAFTYAILNTKRQITKRQKLKTADHKTTEDQNVRGTKRQKALNGRSSKRQKLKTAEGTKRQKAQNGRQFLYFYIYSIV
jgi:hypothetical protein